ncbi:MAG: hypothetical protein L0G99_15495 [Propionibacteriales bacterium]|nr:hypothetical protein [Propionibacteriales bacterium]
MVNGEPVGYVGDKFQPYPGAVDVPNERKMVDPVALVVGGVMGTATAIVIALVVWQGVGYQWFALLPLSVIVAVLSGRWADRVRASRTSPARAAELAPAVERRPGITETITATESRWPDEMPPPR